MHPATLVLAAARLTTLVTQDEITAPLRDATRHRPRLAYLVNCAPCVSVYAAAATLLSARIPLLRPLIRVLALSQTALLTLDAIDFLATKLAPAPPPLDLTLPGEPTYAPAPTSTPNSHPNHEHAPF